MKIKSQPAPVVILGGGLAGISTAYHLRKIKSLIIEKEKELGGMARSIKVDGFTFDFTGHLLHLHHPATKRLIKKLLKNNFYSCTRKASIFSHGKLTRYPFQANTFGLPQDVIDDCVLEFFEAYRKKSFQIKIDKKLDFSLWSDHIFGKGISRHFMIPYNEKLFQVPAHSMTVEWCGPFVPRPTLEEVVRGALVDQTKHFGYNATFLYPKKGGIQVLPDSLGRGLKNIELGTSITRIDWREKEIWLSSGKIVPYHSLVNTLPLDVALQLMKPLPFAVAQAGQRLKSVGILCLNLGVNRAHISDQSWIYFPEEKYPFYRVGFPMNFTPSVVPTGCSSMYVEIPQKTAMRHSKKKLLEIVRTSLIDCNILRPSDHFVTRQFLPIPHAYVIYDKYRSLALKRIFQFLSQHSIQSIGRYGAWKYSFMEEAILDGKKAAEKIIGRKN